MSTLKKQKSTQDIRSAVFTWAHDDAMVDTLGVSKDFGSSVLAARTYDVIQLPVGAVVVGGSLCITEAFDTAGYDVFVGDAGDVDRYLATADLKAIGTSPLLVTGVAATPANQAVKLCVATDDVCTTGEATLIVNYVVGNRANEVA